MIPKLQQYIINNYEGFNTTHFDETNAKFKLQIVKTLLRRLKTLFIPSPPG